MKLPEGWTKANNALTYETKCTNFKEALDLVNSIGKIAEQLQHHPDITIRNYNEVFVSTTTHDKGGVSEKDYELAQAIADAVKANL